MLAGTRRLCMAKFWVRLPVSPPKKRKDHKMSQLITPWEVQLLEYLDKKIDGKYAVDAINARIKRHKWYRNQLSLRFDVSDLFPEMYEENFGVVRQARGWSDDGIQNVLKHFVQHINEAGWFAKLDSSSFIRGERIIITHPSGVSGVRRFLRRQLRKLKK